MSFILNVNTIYKNTEVFLQSNNKIVDFLCIEKENSQSELLVNTVEKILLKNNIEYKDIDCFSALSGPGSFMGIKVAVSFMKAIQSVYPNKKFILNNVFEILSFGEKFDYILIKADIRNYYLYDKNISLINSFDNIKKGSKIITDLDGLPEGFEYIKKNVNNETIKALNIYKYNNALFNKILDPFYVREPQINRKK